MLPALAVALPGCSQGARQQLADAVARSVDRRRGAVEVGHYEASLSPSKAPGGQLLQRLPTGTLASLDVAVAAGERRAALITPSERAPVVLYDATTIYARRVTKSPADRRLWARLELASLPTARPPAFQQATRGTGPGDIAVVGPLLLIDLLSGVLTGSVKQVGIDADGNRKITFNTSISKADRKLHVDDEGRKTRSKLLTSLAITDDIHRGEAILRKDGSLAGVTMVLAEQPDKQTTIDVRAAMTVEPLAPAAGRIDLSSPDRESTVRVPALGSLKGVISEQLKPPTSGLPAAPGLAATIQPVGQRTPQ